MRKLIGKVLLFHSLLDGIGYTHGDVELRVMVYYLDFFFFLFFLFSGLLSGGFIFPSVCPYSCKLKEV